MEMTPDRMQQYLKPRARHALLLWLILAASVMSAVWAGSELYRQYRHLLQQEQAVTMLRRVSERKPAPKPSRAVLEINRQWSSLRAELSFSWYPMFAALERTSNPDIALLEFVPDKGTGRLVLRGIARDLNAMAAYLDALSNEPGLKEVYLSHQKTVQQQGHPVVSFEIRLRLTV